jgi:hypothetical protein
MIDHDRANEFQADQGMGYLAAVGGQDPDFVLVSTRASGLCRIPFLRRIFLTIQGFKKYIALKIANRRDKNSPS